MLDDVEDLVVAHFGFGADFREALRARFQIGDAGNVLTVEDTVATLGVVAGSGADEVTIGNVSHAATLRLGDGREVAGYYLFVWPFTALNLYPWGISLNAIQPLGEARTRIHYRAFEWAPELRGEGAGAARAGACRGRRPGTA